MNRVVEIAELKSDYETPTVSSLIELYDGVLDELRACADVNPLEDDNSEETDLRESVLLDLEESLLNDAATIESESNEDILGLIEMWGKVRDVTGEQEPTPSDRIAMNIFRHITGVQLSKD
jgi:hypothetical protein